MNPLLECCKHCHLVFALARNLLLLIHLRLQTCAVHDDTATDFSRNGTCPSSAEGLLLLNAPSMLMNMHLWTVVSLS